MTKHYKQPATQTQPICPTATICVGSVHGNANLDFGGGSDGSEDDKKPF